MLNIESSLLQKKNETENFMYEKNVRLYQEPIAQQCVICRGTKTSPLEMNCTCCDRYCYMTENGIFVLSQYKETLLECGIITKDEENIFVKKR